MKRAVLCRLSSAVRFPLPPYPFASETGCATSTCTRYISAIVTAVATATAIPMRG
jgi:hypothetical protein